MNFAPRRMKVEVTPKFEKDELLKLPRTDRSSAGSIAS